MTQVMLKRMNPIYLIAALFLFCGQLASQTDVDKDRVLKVGIKESPPFTIKEDNGEWTGMSADLGKLLLSVSSFVLSG